MKSPHYQRGHIEIDGGDFTPPKKSFNLLAWVVPVSILGMLLAVPGAFYAQKWIINNLMVEPKSVQMYEVVDTELMERLYTKCLDGHRERIGPFAAQCGDTAKKMATSLKPVKESP